MIKDRTILEAISLRRLILFISTLLTTLGLLVQLSVGSVFGLVTYGDNYHLVRKHIASVVIGVLIYSIVKFFTKEFLMKYTKSVMVGSLIFLVAVKLEGLNANGAVRWLTCGPVKCQPSEFVKIAVILWISMHVYNYSDNLGNLKNLIQFTFFPLLLALVVLEQPDYGTFVLIVGVTITMLFFSRISWLLLSLFSIGGLIGLASISIAQPYRLRRLDAWLSNCETTEQQLGVCWQLLQSKAAIGTGGLLGIGPGNSYSRWGYLPSAHSDMVGSIIGEEYGFIGLFLITVLYAVFIFSLFIFSASASNDYDKFIRLGFATWILIQTIFNLGGTVGLLPITGIVLPFISYGGSAMVANFIGLGLVLRDD